MAKKTEDGPGIDAWLNSAPADADPNADLHEAFSRSIRAILLMSQAAEGRITPEQTADVKRRLADGSGLLALFVTNDGAEVKATLAMIKPPTEEVFDPHLLKLHGTILAAALPAEAMRIVDLQKMN